MKIVILGFCLLPMTAAAAVNQFVDPLERDGWSATNQDGFCSLRLSAGSADAKLEFAFMSRLRDDDQPPGITFHAISIPSNLTWPVRVSLGSDPDATQIEMGGESSSSTFLAGSDAEQLFRYLKTGGDLHVVYSLSDGTDRRVTLYRRKFSQSAAVFEACTAHVA